MQYSFVKGIFEIWLQNWANNINRDNTKWILQYLKIHSHI